MNNTNYLQDDKSLKELENSSDENYNSPEIFSYAWQWQQSCNHHLE